MGLLAGGLGDLRGARESFERVLELSRQYDYPRGEVVARINLGESLQSAGELEASRAHFEAALKVLERAPSRRGRLMCLMNLGQIAQLLRDPDASRKHLVESEQNIQEGGERRYGSMMHQARAEIAAMDGNAEGMEVAGRDMTATADSIGFVWAAAFGSAYVAQARVALADRDGALDAVRDLHRRAADADFEVHHASFALEAARWILAFGRDPAASKQASACVSTLAASKTTDFWVVKRAQELADTRRLPADPAAKGESREWMATMEALLPRATIAA
jgi:tetratricopeptide (TPR) repeat protein